jgi:hypothetical protein
MEQRTGTPLNTREFVVKWHATVDDHLVGKLAESLVQAAAAQPGGTALEPAQARALAHHIITALHLAAAPGAGVPEGVDYLIQAAAEATGA